MYILRFYGSCGHITNEEISEELFIEYSKEILVKTIFGNVLHKNEITKENEKQIVHIHPFRFCICRDCMKEEVIKIERGIW